jgi:hypothetical protein
MPNGVLRGAMMGSPRPNLSHRLGIGILVSYLDTNLPIDGGEALSNFTWRGLVRFRFRARGCSPWSFPASLN